MPRGNHLQFYGRLTAWLNANRRKKPGEVDMIAGLALSGTIHHAETTGMYYVSASEDHLWEEMTAILERASDTQDRVAELS